MCSIHVCMQYAYQNCMMSSCCWAMFCTTRREVYPSPCLDTMLSLVKISQYHVSQCTGYASPFWTKFCIHPFAKSPTKHQTHCCPWHILPWRTWLKGNSNSKSCRQHFILQTSVITFCFICCHLWPLWKKQRVFFLSGRTIKVWIHASSHLSYSFLMLLLHTISGCNYCHMHLHTTYIISMHTLYLYILGVARSSSSRMKVYRNPLQKHVMVTVPGRNLSAPLRPWYRW